VRRAAPAALLLAMALAFSPAADARKKRHKPAPCSLSGSKTLLATRDARIYYRDDAKKGTVSEYACLFARNKRFLMASGDDSPGGSGDSASLERLSSGGYVAFARSHYDDSQRYNPSFVGFPWRVVAINLSTGAQLSFAPLTGNPTTATVTDLVLAADGSFAWIGTSAGSEEVHRLNAGDAADTVLDSGADIQTGSLALGGRTLYWTKAGNPVLAPIGKP
jgi:hypothetical protein